MTARVHHYQALMAQREQQTTVYRYYDAEDRLLYVGCSARPFHRVTNHKDKPWMNDVARATFERFPNFWLARQSEAEAIRSEAPLYNVLHNEANPARMPYELLPPSGFRGILHRLPDDAVEVLACGFHPDGGGLYLCIKPRSKSWCFRYTSPITMKRREMGLGRATLPLIAARAKAAELRNLVAQGIDPLATTASKNDPKRHLLRDDQIATLPDGRHNDGGGLYLLVRGRSRTWNYRFQLDGKRRDMSLGVFPFMDLEQARAAHFAAASLRKQGDDPLDAKHAMQRRPWRRPKR
ncbi:integrase arm-type DNA-binding domain-containing protein [Paracoccus sp. KR1-242]|uniref:integrase arm-type DNA-binding domain-containing protein n=1 Tax=Paracoccus sp. KR1-242 TaxID=3410028 RepID=UPI003C00CC06